MNKKTKCTNFTDLKDMLNKTGEVYGENTAFMLKTEKPGQFKTITHKEFRNEINALGTTLIKMGLKDKRIAVISENRYEWEVAYLAVVAGTGVVVPLDKALPGNEIESLILRSQVEAIFYSNKYQDVMDDLRNKKNTNIKYFISMDLEESVDGIYSQKALIEKGRKLLQEGNKEYIEAKINPTEMGILLFTSGTTAMSKAVMLSHKNVVSNIMDFIAIYDVNENDRLLSFLPLHHALESAAGFLYPVSVGATICFSEGVKHMADNIKEFGITAMISVPAVFEVIYRRIMKTIEKQGKMETVKKGIKISQALLKIKIDIRKKVFKEIHEKLGGKLRLTLGGGAPLDPETQKGFDELGITLLQGYGLTEASPVIAAESPKYKRVGSTGKPIPSVEVKIDNPNEEGIGELLAKGPNIMLGYYENEEATNEIIDKDGWLHTGDLARIDKDGYIYISGRKKNVIVLNNGKNVFPEELENLLNKIEGVKESFVYEKKENDGDIKVCAKIVYDKELIKEIYNVDDVDKTREILWEKVKEVNNIMPKYKSIREVIITEEELIKTTTLKIKRHEELKKIL